MFIRIYYYFISQRFPSFLSDVVNDTFCPKQTKIESLVTIDCHVFNGNRMLPAPDIKGHQRLGNAVRIIKSKCRRVSSFERASQVDDRSSAARVDDSRRRKNPEAGWEAGEDERGGLACARAPQTITSARLGLLLSGPRSLTLPCFPRCSPTVSLCLSIFFHPPRRMSLQRGGVTHAHAGRAGRPTPT